MIELTKEKLESILDSCMKTTQGPWISYVEGRDHESGSSFIMTGAEDIELTGATIADQDFIASAKQDIPLLVMEIYRLQNLLAIK